MAELPGPFMLYVMCVGEHPLSVVMYKGYFLLEYLP